MKTPQGHPQSNGCYGWVKGQLVLTEPRQLIFSSEDTPQLIHVVIPHHLVMAILHKGLNLNQIWKVSPQTYPFNGIVSKFKIDELPQPPKNNDSKDGIFLIIGTVIFRHGSKLKILTKSNQQVVIQGEIS